MTLTEEQAENNEVTFKMVQDPADFDSTIFMHFSGKFCIYG